MAFHCLGNDQQRITTTRADDYTNSSYIFICTLHRSAIINGDLYIHILSHNFIKFCHIYNFIVYGNVKDSLGSML